MHPRNPYVFVVGCPRSGTTLLQRMLDSHPALAVINDSLFIPGAIDVLDHASDIRLTPEIVSRARSYRSSSGKTGFFRLGLEDVAVDRAAQRARTYSTFVTRLYDEVARSRGKPHAGEKTPDYVRHLPLLHRLFPGARFVHIIRDGRSVTLSLREWAAVGKGPARHALWAEEPIAMCALWWRWQVSTGRRDAAALGPDFYREVRYEELVADPEPVLREVAGFLGLPYSPAMLRYFEGKVRGSSGLSAKKAWLPPTPGLRDWRTEMTEAELELCEAVAGDLLNELGYERACEPISPNVAERSRRWRDWWDAELASPHTVSVPG